MHLTPGRLSYIQQGLKTKIKTYSNIPRDLNNEYQLIHQQASQYIFSNCNKYWPSLIAAQHFKTWSQTDSGDDVGTFTPCACYQTSWSAGLAVRGLQK